MRVPFLGGFDKRRSVNVSAGTLVNLYLETAQTAKSPLSAFLAPGKELFAQLYGEIRGLWALDGYLYAVAAAKFYQISDNGATFYKGTLNSSTGPVSISDNGTQIMLADGNGGYIFTVATNAFAQISSDEYLGGDVVTFQDGYFIVGPNGRQSFQISALYDGTTWSSSDTAPAEGLPDRLLSLLSDHRELWLFGEESTEVFWNSGNADFPFERISGAFIEMGCSAKYSPAKVDNSVFWLTRNKNGEGQVVRADGYTPSIISSRALEQELGTYSTVSDAIGWCYQQEGHTFYCVTFPTAGKSWVYDCSIQDPELAWAQRVSYGLTRDRANCHAFMNRTHFVGDYQNGKIYKLKTDVYNEDGDPLTWERAGQYIHQDRQRLFFGRFEVDIETGVGLSSGQGSDPQIALDWSDDGGHTWSNKLFRSMGSIGEYNKRVFWNKLGASKGPHGRIFRLSGSDPVKTTIIDAFCDMTAGR